jgi:hypothetical protein
MVLDPGVIFLLFAIVWIILCLIARKLFIDYGGEDGSLSNLCLILTYICCIAACVWGLIYLYFASQLKKSGLTQEKIDHYNRNKTLGYNTMVWLTAFGAFFAFVLVLVLVLVKPIK